MENRIIPVYFEKKLFEKIEELAKKYGVAKPAIIRNIIKTHFQSEKNIPIKKEA